MVRGSLHTALSAGRPIIIIALEVQNDALAESHYAQVMPGRSCHKTLFLRLGPLRASVG